MAVKFNVIDTQATQQTQQYTRSKDSWWDSNEIPMTTSMKYTDEDSGGTTILWGDQAERDTYMTRGADFLLPGVK
jgi:hypothetical protein